MNEPAFTALVTRIRNALGSSKELASDYAAAIGEKPEVENGKIIVRGENGRIIAHLPLSVLE